MVVWMDGIGDIDGITSYADIGCFAQADMAVCIRDSFVLQALLRQEGVGFFGDDDQVFCLEMGLLTVFLMDELLHGMDPISDDIGGDSAAGGEEFSSHGLDAQVVAMDVFLDDSSALVFFENELC